MATKYLGKRDLVLKTLDNLGFEHCTPQGAYYIIFDFAKTGMKDTEFVDFLLDKAQIGVVPGSSFYENPTQGEHQARLCYALREEVIHQAMENLAALPI